MCQSAATRRCGWGCWCRPCRRWRPACASPPRTTASARCSPRRKCATVSATLRHTDITYCSLSSLILLLLACNTPLPGKGISPRLPDFSIYDQRPLEVCRDVLWHNIHWMLEMVTDHSVRESNLRGKFINSAMTFCTVGTCG